MKTFNSYEIDVQFDIKDRKTKFGWDVVPTLATLVVADEKEILEYLIARFDSIQNCRISKRLRNIHSGFGADFDGDVMSMYACPITPMVNNSHVAVRYPVTNVKSVKHIKRK